MVSLVGESSLRPDEVCNEKTEGQKGDLFEVEPAWPVCTMLTCTTQTPDFVSRNMTLVCSFGVSISLLCQPQEEKTLYSMSVSRWYLNYIQMKFSIIILRHGVGKWVMQKYLLILPCSSSCLLCKIILLQNSLIMRVILIVVA